MKLSEKGLKRLLDVAFDGDEFYQSNALEVEFEPDDFQGGYFQNGKDHIVLTVEEAKYALKVVRFAIITCEVVHKHKDQLWNFASLLHKRIEQVEGK